MVVEVADMVMDMEVDMVADMVAVRLSDFHSVSISEPSQSIEMTLWWPPSPRRSLPFPRRLPPSLSFASLSYGQDYVRNFFFGPQSTFYRAVLEITFFIYHYFH